ncbi:MAG: hypothetical protein FWD93_03040 [Coriobacteriia bacterium]|nr:hypothetical protein [Coriobacteriia bacterium]
MNKFSNINWAAFLLGGFWAALNKIWSWFFLWLVIFLISSRSVEVLIALERHGEVLAYAYNADVHITIIIIGNIAMNIIAIYLTLQGSRMISEENTDNDLISEENSMAEIAAKKRQYIIYGIIFKGSYLAYSASPSMVLVYALLIVNLLSFALVLHLALRLRMEDDEFHSVPR